DARQRDRLREAEERLLFTFRAGRVLGWEYDLSTGRILRTDPMHDWLGLPPTTPLDTLSSISAFVHPDDAAGWARDLATACAGGELEAEFRLLRPDGGVIWVRSFGRAVLGPDGLPGKLVGVHLDITDRREREDRLRLLESAVVHAHDAVV